MGLVDKTIHEVFESRAQETPDAIAASYEDQKISYAELNQKANQLAHSLRRLGVKHEILVGISMDRSIEMMAAILGVLKAGGAYVPLDPAYPQERLEFMLEDTQTPVLITQSHLRGRYPKYKGHVLEIDRQEFEKESQDNLGPLCSPSNLIYVIYTSGSTGRPKGVMIAHENLSHYLNWAREAFEVTEKDIIDFSGSLSFDFSVHFIFLSLTTGAELAICEEEKKIDPNEYFEYLAERRVTLFGRTPTHFSRLNEFKAGYDLSCVRSVVVAGEPAIPSDIASWLDYFPTQQVVNIYGPTETTVATTWFVVDRENIKKYTSSIPIGKAIPNSQLYILDQNMKEVPEGELYIGGKGLARGYLNRPELTRERFIQYRGLRLYKTGDLVRWLPDGNLDYLGRIDDQVKIRGFRIELGEIEYVLRQDPRISNCVVIAREDLPGEKRLIAYLVAREEEALIASIRQLLSQTLPGFMIPSAFVFLKELPLTPNNKIDRKALPAPEAEYRPSKYIAPRNRLEEKLSLIWSELLKVKPIGIEDNFFSLGGHSLLVMKLLARLKEEFQMTLPFRCLFDYPTIESLAAAIAEEQKEENFPIIPLVPQPRGSLIPLSFAEQRLWFLDQIIADRTVYNLPFEMRLKGNLNIAALEKAFRALIHRHEILRTRFKVVYGQPEQVIEEKVEFLIDTENADTKVVFDLSQAPLMRVKLLTLSKDDRRLIIVLHHIIADEWSMGIFMRELGAFYNHYAFDKPLEMEELTIQYADYAIWQRAWLQGEVLEKQLKYWESQLSGIPETLDFPFDRPRPPISSYRGNIHEFVLSKKSLHALKQLGEQHQATLFMVLMAGLQVLLHRYTGQEDIVVGSPIAHRNHKEVEGLIGFFVNMIALKVHFADSGSFTDILKQVREAALAAYAHQDVPFEQLVEYLNIPRDLGKNPVFQVVLAVQTESIRLELMGLEAQPFKLNMDQAMFDLTFSVKEQLSGELQITIEYATDLFEASTIERLARHFTLLLEGVIQHPESKIEEINFLTALEREQILVQWNQTQEDYPRDKTLQELFEAQAEKSPDAVAVIFEDQQMTYRELNQKAHQLACAIQVMPETVVAICMDRSIDMMVGLLAILKAGGAYVPLDPAYPHERLEFMLEDTAAPVLIIQSHLREKFLGFKGRIIEIDKHQGGNERWVSSSLAYVIYTSGSTGKPKGVLIEHASICDRLRWCQSYCPLTPSDRFLHLFSFSFDGAVLSCWWPLIAGATLVIPSLQGMSDPDYLIGLMKRHRVTTLFSTPSLLQFIFQNLTESTLSMVIAGGEELKKELSEQILAMVPKLYNFYGPTECAVMATAWKGKAGEEPSIGYPIANTTVYILNSALQPVPPNVKGEMYIGGKNLARGYLNRPELTQQRFITDPFNRNSKLYKTGDLACHSPEGSLTYLGRIDEQVKIRGYRIELGEIESLLRQHPLVKECVVLAKDSSRIVAYLVLKDKTEDVLQTLRQLLGRELPEYMMPSAFVVLDRIPLTPNGKIDRQLLLSMKVEQPAEVTAPATETEEALVSLCSQLLKVEKVSCGDNFFQIGGHSLLAAQLIAMLKKHYQIEIPLRLLFQHPILSDLAEEIDKLVRDQKGLALNELPPLKIDPVHRFDPFPLTDVQQAYLIGRSGFFELSQVAAHLYKEFDYTKLDLKRLEAALNQLIERHEALRLTFTTETQQILQTVPHYSIAVTDLSDRTAGEIELYLKEIREKLSHEILPADRWPLFDIRATKLPGKIRLHLSFDGLIFDGWSYALLFAEWIALYHNPALKLPKLELSFRDYVIFQKSIEMTPLYERDKQYWHNRLPTFPEAPSFPLAKNPSELHKQKFSRLTFNLPEDKWTGLQDQIRKKELSPAGVLAALLAEVIARWSSASHFALNLTLFNRLPVHPEVNAIMGDFTSVLLLEVDHRNRENFLSRGRRLQEQLWKDLDHSAYGGIPFIRELAHRQKKEGSALMPVVFTCALQSGGSALKEKFHEDAMAPFAISQTPQLWLDCKAYEEEGRLVIEWDYLEELFPQGFVQEMHTAFCTLTQEFADHPFMWEETTFNLIPEQQILRRAEVNDTAWEPPFCLLHELFHAAAARYPHNPAVLSSRGNLTYLELQNYSNQLGHKLRELQVLPNQLVAVVMEKGWEQVVGCLGILNSGAAYLPLDPELPFARLESLLKRAEVSIILTQSEHQNKLPKTAHIICIDQIDKLLKDYSTALLAPVQKLDDLAYVIFTSGSTGEPKGVMIDHQGVVNTILDINDRYDVKSTDRAFAISNLNFDLSVYDIFGLLAAGGAIIMPPQLSSKDPKVWNEWILREKATIWNSVPMLMQMLLEEVESHEEKKHSFRLVLLSGDMIPLNLADKIHRTFLGPLEVISLGGATEASIWSIYYPIHHIEKEWKTIPYGKPLRNQQYYVLNDNFDVCPDWVPGGLYIGGIGLAKGYWKDEQKTEASFILHPHTRQRLFKTGDLGRYFPDGNIEFLGRTDFQVKISGHRIELSEIEFHLLHDPLVDKAVANVFKDPQGNKYLTAYVVFKKSGLVKDIGEVIQDPSSRLSFKLAQHGIEKLPPENQRISLEFTDAIEKWFSRKSYRTYQSKVIKREDLEKLLKESFSIQADKTAKPVEITEKSLSLLLQELRAVESGEIPKYRYGSAGGLYPLQVYIEIPEGLFYYHPLHHELIKMGPARSSACTLYLVAKRDAIDPMYGTLAGDFCYLEAGYMRPLLYSACNQLGWGVDEEIAPENTPFLQEGYQLISTLKLSHQEHVPSFKGDIRIYIKSGRVEGLEGGWYSSSLQQLSSDTPLDFIPSVGEMSSAFHEAAFYIFFLGPSSHKSSLIQAGDYVQRLMEEGIKHSIGFCPIGNLDTYTADCLSPHEVLHTLIGGRISQDQILSREVSNPRGAEFFQAYLSESLRKHLPSYMVPAYFVFLDQIPLSINGKVDRKALPSPTVARVHSEVAPRSYMEMVLESLWKECLKTSSVSVNDNFFEIGGNSLLMVRLVIQINQSKSLGGALSISDFINHPTIAGLANVLTTKVVNPLSKTVLVIQSEGPNIPLFLIHPAAGLALPYLPLANYFKQQPLYGIRNPRFAQPEKAFQTVEEMAAEYIQTVRAVQPKGPYQIGGWSLGGIIALEIARQLKAQGETIKLVLMIDSYDAGPEFYQEESPPAREALQKFIEPYGLDIDSDEGRSIIFEILNTNKILAKYQPEPYDGRVVLVKARGGTDTKNLNEKERKVHLALAADPHNGWGKLVPHLTSFSVEGEHDLLFTPSYIGGVAAAMEQVL